MEAGTRVTSLSCPCVRSVVSEQIPLLIDSKHDIICGQILYTKSSVFLHVFNNISTYAYVFTGYFLHFSVI